MLLSVTLQPILVPVFPVWLLALGGILLIKARGIPRDAGLSSASLGRPGGFSPDRDDAGGSGYH